MMKNMKKAIVPAFLLLIVIGAALILILKNNQLPAGATESPKPINEAEAYLLSLNRDNGAAGYDLRDKNFSKVPLEVLADVNFDSLTLWPDSSKLPQGFSPEGWLQSAKTHGSGLDRLHEAGITGKGVSIAVFDKPINERHMEFSGRLVYILTDNPGDFEKLHFHGISCASIIGGNSCGVAPEVTLYYFACPDNGQNFQNYCRAMDKLIEFNQTLPEDQKIRLVSISDGLYPESAIWPEWNIALEKAKKEGIDVNYSNGLEKWKLAYGGCPPYADREDPDSYIPDSLIRKGRIPKNITFIPSCFRTTAANEGNEVYRYWASGGFSWAIAYVSGLSALAYQVNPEITYDEIVALLCSTPIQSKESYDLVDPEAFIEAVRQYKP